MCRGMGAEGQAGGLYPDRDGCEGLKDVVGVGVAQRISLEFHDSVRGVTFRFSAAYRWGWFCSSVYRGDSCCIPMLARINCSMSHSQRLTSSSRCPTGFTVNLSISTYDFPSSPSLVCSDNYQSEFLIFVPLALPSRSAVASSSMPLYFVDGVERSQASTDADISKPSKRLKRMLKTTVATGLAAVAAALLSHSDEIGDWLMAVAPKVMPHAGAGAEMVHKAIEGAKSCYKEGANICLDAEGRATALCESLLLQYHVSGGCCAMWWL